MQKLFPSFRQYDVHMERETLFYHVWIGAALGFQGCIDVFKQEAIWGKAISWRSFVPYACIMTLVIYIQVFAVFKISCYGEILPGQNDLFDAFPFGGSIGPYFLARMLAYH